MHSFFFGRSSPCSNIYAVSNLKRKLKAVLGDKSVTFGKGKGQKQKIYSPINLYFLIHLFETNSTAPNKTGYDEVKIMMTSLPIPDEFTFSGIHRLVSMYILFLI